MSGDVTIRRAVRGDEAAILDLLRVSLGEGTIPRTLDYWRWKHVANPFGESPVLVGEADGQLVALRAFMRWTWRSGGQDVSAVRAVDTATHPDHRGQGLFKRLTLRLRDEMQGEGVAFVYNTPNAQSRPGYLKMGWSLLGKPTLWVRPARPVRLAMALRRDGLGGDEGEPPAVDAERARDVLALPTVRAIIKAAEDGGVAYRTVPTTDYLHWRYADIPGFAYYAAAKGDGAEGALLVMRARQRGTLRELRICDLVVGPTSEARRNARVLLGRLPRVADVDVVLGMQPPGLGAGALVASGYLPAPRTGPILTAYPLNTAALPDPCTLAHWQPQVGALELF